MQKINFLTQDNFVQINSRYSSFFEKLQAPGEIKHKRQFYDHGFNLIINNLAHLDINNVYFNYNNNDKNYLVKLNNFFLIVETFFQRLETTKIPIQDYKNNYYLITEIKQVKKLNELNLSNRKKILYLDEINTILDKMVEIILISTEKNLHNFQNKKLIKQLNDEGERNSNFSFYLDYNKFLNDLLMKLDKHNIDKKVITPQNKKTTKL